MIRSRLLVLIAFALLLGWWSLSAQKEDQPVVEVALLDEHNWERFAPKGKEVDAIYGDLVLRNAYLTAVIAQPTASRHANMTVRAIAGALIDMATREGPSDQLSAFYPGQNAFVYRSWKIIDEHGAEHSAASHEVTQGASGSVVVTAEAAEGQPHVEVRYTLEEESKSLEVATTFKNPSQQPLTINLADGLRIDTGKEDVGRSGSGESDQVFVDDRYWRQAYVVSATDRKLQYVAEGRPHSIKYVDEQKSNEIILAPGDSLTFQRLITCGPNVFAAQAAMRPEVKTSLVTLAVRDSANRPVTGARLDINQSETLLGEIRANERGECTIPLAEGDYRVRVRINGAEVVQAHALKVLAGDQQSETLILPAFQLGMVVGKITDAAGGPIPCKVDFLPKAGTPKPDFAPETAELAVKNLRYAPRGEFKQELHPGVYDVIISHGPEFDAIFTELTVTAGQHTPLKGQLIRSVQTPGWVSSDFHSHSSPSGDNTSSQLGRVINLVCEHLEFAPCTEHNRISTYQPHIDSLKVQPFISTVSGMELTGNPLPLNHQNTFPLVLHPNLQDGGAPVTEGDPETQIERIALWDNRSEKLIQQNHPDLGWLFYDRNGDGIRDEGQKTFPFMDVIEVHPISEASQLDPKFGPEDKPNPHTFFSWLQLLNQGYKHYGVVNTDAHYNYHGSGWLRNWIQSTTDDPAQIDHMDMVHASEQGRLIMSNAPYLEVTAAVANQPAVTVGQSLEAEGGEIELHVRVQTPNWCNIDRVLVLANGRPIEDFTREKHPDRFTDETLKFDHKLALKLTADTHLIVIAIGENSTLGPVVGPDHASTRPVAISNPIFADVDGSGFKPNGDTLDYPLPNKFDVKPAAK